MRLKGINIAVGLHHCGDSEKIYDMVLESFYEESMVKLPQIEASFQSKDYKMYVILVHGLKSVAMSIGALELSNLAKKLEMAVKEGDFTFAEDHQEEFIRCYKELLEELHKYRINKV